VLPESMKIEPKPPCDYVKQSKRTVHTRETLLSLALRPDFCRNTQNPQALSEDK
jgi:hypothetical protein